MKYGCSSLVPAKFQIAEIEQRYMKDRAFKDLAAAKTESAGKRGDED